MNHELPQSLWISGSEHFSAVVDECRSMLEEIGIRVLGRRWLLPGAEITSQTEEGIRQAAGIVIFLGPHWATTSCLDEGTLIAANVESAKPIWIVSATAAIDPPTIQAWSRISPHVRRLPRDQKPLTQLPRQGRTVLFETLRRSVAAQLGLPPPQDGQYGQLQAYRKGRSEQLEFVPLRGFFGAQHVDTARGFRFTDLFVPLQLEWLRQPVQIAEQYKKLTALIADEKLPARRRWELAEERNALVSRYGLADVQKIDEALSRFPQLMLLGKPGSGKSSILHGLEMQAHQRGSELAVQIRLQNIAEKACFGESLWPQILQYIRVTHGPDVTDAFEECADEGRALLLLDGVDEVQKEHRARLLSSVDSMLLGRPKLRCVVTSRLAVDCWLDTRIPHLRVAELNQEEIASFVLNHQRCEDPSTAELRAKELLKILGARGQLSELARNPLSLRLLCLLAQTPGGLPLEHVLLYERAIQTLIETWPANRVARKVRVSASDLRQVLASAAAWMHERGTREAHRTDLIRHFETALPRTKAKTAGQLAVHCLDVAAVHAGILVESSPEHFEFLHLTFTEYLSAEHRIRKEDLGALAAQRDDSRYHQVIPFAAGILRHIERRPNDAATFVRALTDEPSGSADQILHPYLPLATVCLGDGTRLPSDLVDDVLCALLRAATVPLTSISEAVRRILGILSVPPTERVVAACAALIDHPLVALREAVVRFLSVHTADHPKAQTLCLQALTDQSDIVACHATLGLIRAGVLPVDELHRIAVRLAYCFHPSVAAVDEVATWIRRREPLHAKLVAIYEDEASRFRAQAARLLSLLHPDDWALLSVLLESPSSEDIQAITRAALRSERNAERIVDLYVAEQGAGNRSQSSMGSILQSLFGDSEAVRRRLLFHYRRPLPEDLEWSSRSSPELAFAKTAAEFLKNVVDSGENRPRNLKQLLCALQGLLPDADVDLCRRIATLGAAIRAPAGWLADAISRCMQAGGVYRVWAIDAAFEHKLYDLAVAGALARAETSSCLAAAVFDMKRRLGRHRGDNQPMVSALTRQPQGTLRDALLLLCQVNSGAESASQLESWLDGPPGAVPMPLCFWAASEIAFWARRLNEKTPHRLGSALLALASSTWPIPADVRWLAPQSKRPPSWIPKSDRSSHFDYWIEDVELSEAGAQQVAFEQAQVAIAWLRELVRTGAEIGWHLTDHNQAWLRKTITAHLLLVDELVHDVDHPQADRRDVARWLLPTLCRSDRELADGDRGNASNAQTIIHDRILHLLEGAPLSFRWSVIEYMSSRGLCGGRLHAALVAFLSTEYEMSLRWTALTRLAPSEATSAAELSVLRDALAAEDPSLRIEAADRIIARKIIELDCIGALQPLLASSSPEHRLDAVALWLRLADADRAMAVPILIGLLGHLAPISHRSHFRVSRALEHLNGPSTGSKRSFRSLNEFASNRETGIGCLAALLLSAVGGHEEELRTAAAAWLDALPDHDEESLPQPWLDRRHLALSIFVRFGIEQAGASIDRALLGLLAAEGRHAQETIGWMQELRWISQPLLQKLLRVLLDVRYEGDEKFARWVVTWARQDQRVLQDLRAVLMAAMRTSASPAHDYPDALLQILFVISEIDDEVAEFFVRHAARRSISHNSEPTWSAAMVEHPSVRSTLLAALASYPAYERLWLIDWLLPWKAVTPENGTPMPSVAQDVLDLLRSWLAHADYGLRIEAGGRLYYLGHRDEQVMQALRSCLQAPLDWTGTYYGDGARRAAGKFLRDVGEVSSQELLESFLPIFSAAVTSSDLEHTMELIVGIEDCRRPVLDAAMVALHGRHAEARGDWQVMQRLFQLGLPDEDRLPLLLHALAEGRSYPNDVAKELRRLLDGRGAEPHDEAQLSAEEETGNGRRARLRHGPLRGAARLAELTSWPQRLLDALASILACPWEDLFLLEEQGEILEQRRAVALLEPLLHHHPDENPVKQLVRHACLLRFGKFVGITEERLPYELTG